MHIYEQKFSFIATLKIMTIPWEQYSNIFHHLLHLNYKHKNRASLENCQPKFLEHNSVNQCDLHFVLLYISDDCGQHAALVSYVNPTNMHVCE